jgi:hypothetical protein
MKNQAPKLVVYGRSYEEAMDIVWNNRLRDCEPLAEPLIGLLFPTDVDAVLFRIGFWSESVFEGSLAILAPCHRADVLEFLQNYSMEDRVQWLDLLGVWFWSDEDNTTFNEALEIEAAQSPELLHS